MKKITAEYRYTAEQLNRVRELANTCGLREITAKILFSRGIDTPEKAKRFLSPSKANFLSPFLMRGMRELKAAVDEVVTNSPPINSAWSFSSQVRQSAKV